MLPNAKAGKSPQKLQIWLFEFKRICRCQKVIRASPSSQRAFLVPQVGFVWICGISELEPIAIHRRKWSKNYCPYRIHSEGKTSSFCSASFGPSHRHIRQLPPVKDPKSRLNPGICSNIRQQPAEPMQHRGKCSIPTIPHYFPIWPKLRVRTYYSSSLRWFTLPLHSQVCHELRGNMEVGGKQDTIRHINMSSSKMFQSNPLIWCELPTATLARRQNAQHHASHDLCIERKAAATSPQRRCAGAQHLGGAATCCGAAELFEWFAYMRGQFGNGNRSLDLWRLS